jgi:glycyl-tRNA synthetase beta subunit
LSIVVELIPSINKFFDEVLVMAEDEAVRRTGWRWSGKLPICPTALRI